MGFGDFDLDEQLNNNEVELTFIYQPLIGGKHNIFLAGDFNDWSESETRMNEKDGLYEVTLNLKPGKYYLLAVVDRNESNNFELDPLSFIDVSDIEVKKVWFKYLQPLDINEEKDR